MKDTFVNDVSLDVIWHGCDRGVGYHCSNVDVSREY